MIILEKRVLSVAGALIELKLLEKRIARANNGVFLTLKKGKDLPVGYKDESELEKAVKANYQSAKDLISLRNTIKSKIVLSNATTEVMVGKQKMTVAEAIERKGSISNEYALLNSLKNQYQNVSNELTRYNNNVRGKADDMAEAFLGRDTDKSTKDESKQYGDNYYASNEGKLIDPIGILSAITELENSIEEFEANVDLALTTSNAKTEFEV